MAFFVLKLTLVTTVSTSITIFLAVIFSGATDNGYFPLPGGVEWSGVEWSGVEWSRVQWSRVQCGVHLLTLFASSLTVSLHHHLPHHLPPSLTTCPPQLYASSSSSPTPSPPSSPPSTATPLRPYSSAMQPIAS
jgi:hypothetical protein